MLGHHRSEVLQAHAKALCPRMVVALETLGQAGAAGGKAGIEGVQRVGCVVG